MLLLGGYALNFPQRAIWKLDFYDDNKEGQKHKWWPIGVLKQVYSNFLYNFGINFIVEKLSGNSVL